MTNCDRLKQLLDNEYNHYYSKLNRKKELTAHDQLKYTIRITYLQELMNKYLNRSEDNVE